MDEADFAQLHMEQLEALRRAAEGAREPSRSPLFCEVCGEPIPAARREAARGTRRCLFCQERGEARASRYAAVR